jgi:hypothetical protein
MTFSDAAIDIVTMPFGVLPGPGYAREGLLMAIVLTVLPFVICGCW